MPVSVRHGYDTEYSEAGYVSLCLVKQDCLAFWEVHGREGGCTFRLPFETEEEARTEYERQRRKLGSMA